MDVATAIVAWLQPVWNLLILIGMLIGLALVGIGLSGVHRGIHEGNGQNIHKKLGWITVLFGIILINTPTALNSLSLTIFNSATQSAIAYSGAAAGQYAVIVHAALGIVSLVGLYGVISGLLILKPAANGGRAEDFWHGIRRLVGGTLAVNIVPALHVLGASLGGTMQALVTKLVG
jgi:hypothetical protein